MEAVGAVAWAGLGVVATLFTAWVAERNGWVQISIMRQAHALNVSKAIPQIGCTVIVSFQQVNPVGFNPHAFVTVNIYNEGELAARDLQGYWELRIPGFQQTQFPIQRDFLGHCDKYTHTYKINESGNWPAHRIPVEVDVEFYYSIPGKTKPEQYKDQYRYDSSSRQMIKGPTKVTDHSN